jgi:hypothetical protein
MDYLARVEPHGDRSREDHVLLQVELAKAKFYATIVGSTGTSLFQLPQAPTFAKPPIQTSTARTQRSSKPSERYH